jgi:hypothetical protein
LADVEAFQRVSVLEEYTKLLRQVLVPRRRCRSLGASGKAPTSVGWTRKVNLKRIFRHIERAPEHLPVGGIFEFSAAKAELIAAVKVSRKRADGAVHFPCLT